MKLATIEKILDKSVIEDADRIELIKVLGWNVIAKKDQFQVGDFCIYIPIDTLVDASRPYFSNLRSEKNPDTLVRIKTAKIRGVFSQGLVLPISCINLNSDEIYEGNDVSEILGVKKYEKENILTMQGVNTYNIPFPTEYISKTDEDNLKTKPNCLNEFLNKEIYITKKLDGSSMTLIKTDNKFLVCSRNLILEEGSVMYQYVLREKLKEKLLEQSENLAIQGEFCGPKVNGNQLGLKDYEFYVFNIKNLDTNNYFGLDEMQEFCLKLGIKMVPVLDKLICDENYTVNKFQEIANNIYYTRPNNKKIPGEGIVIRTTKSEYSKVLQKMLSCKVINQNYRD